MATGANSLDADVVLGGVATTGEFVGAVAGRGGVAVGVGVAVTGASGFGGVKTGAADGFVVGASGFGGVKTGAVGVAVTGVSGFVGGVKTGADVGEAGFAEFTGGGKGWGAGIGLDSACGAAGDV